MANKSLAQVSLVESVSDTNSILVEVSGSVRRINIDDFLASTSSNMYADDILAYGVQKLKTSSSSEWTRIGSASLHRALPIQNAMRGVLKKDDGTQTYLPADSWTGADLSGVSGQVMVEVPAHYFKEEETETHIKKFISQYPIVGYTYIPKFYIGAFEGSIQRSTNKLSSVVNTTTDYRGGNNDSTKDSAGNTFLGRPATNISETNFRTYARNRGNGTKWNQRCRIVNDMIYNLFLIEYATTDSQKAVNNTLTTEGYKQGGLGNGPTTISSSDWSTFNGSYPFVPCGHTNSLGNGTGEIQYSATANGVTLTVMANRYRGIELPFGHIWEWCDGYIVDVKTDADGGTSKAYICDNPANFSSVSTANYTYIGDIPRINGYVKKMIGGVQGAILPSEVGGSSSTYYCDYFYTSITTSELKGVLFGGTASSGAYAGLACADSHSAPSFTHSVLGSRLCYIDEVVAF